METVVKFGKSMYRISCRSMSPTVRNLLYHGIILNWVARSCSSLCIINAFVLCIRWSRRPMDYIDRHRRVNRQIWQYITGNGSRNSTYCTSSEARNWDTTIPIQNYAWNIRGYILMLCSTQGHSARVSEVVARNLQYACQRPTRKNQVEITYTREGLLEWTHIYLNRRGACPFQPRSV